jgi:hypothetical protein
VKALKMVNQQINQAVTLYHSQRMTVKGIKECYWSLNFSKIYLIAYSLVDKSSAISSPSKVKCCVLIREIVSFAIHSTKSLFPEIFISNYDLEDNNSLDNPFNFTKLLKGVNKHLQNVTLGWGRFLVNFQEQQHL